MSSTKARGVTHVIFGDLFLEDVRRYREEKLAGTRISGKLIELRPDSGGPKRHGRPDRKPHRKGPRPE